MFKRFSVNYLVALFLIDGILIQSALWLAIQLRFILPYGIDLQQEWISLWVYVPGWRLHAAVGVLWIVIFLVASIYTPRKIIRWIDETQRIVLAHTLSALSLAGLLYMANLELSRLVYAYFYLIALTSLLGYRIILRTWHRLRHETSQSVARILVVGAGKMGQNLVAEFQRQAWPGIEFVGFLDDDPLKQGQQYEALSVLGKIDDAAMIIQNASIDEVIIALPANAHNRLVNLVTALHKLPVRVRVVPDYFGLAYFGATVESLGGIPLVGLRDPAIDEFQLFIKRIMDILLSGFGLVCASPIMALIALAIKLEDNGPIFYHADRVGENGSRFKMWKFRSMVINADKLQQQVNTSDANGNIVHKSAHDPRITTVGRFIRRTSLDELPQLINVLTGEMSMVGPRPELPWLVEKYEPWQRNRFAVPQGITGWWQVNGRSDNAMHLHTDQDLYYVQNYSLWLDFQILWRTVSTVLRGKGAY